MVQNMGYIPPVVVIRYNGWPSTQNGLLSTNGSLVLGRMDDGLVMVSHVMDDLVQTMVWYRI